MWWGWVFSLLDREKTEAVIGQFQAQLVMHFAAASLVGESMVDPGKYYRNDVIGAINLFDGTLQAGVKCLIFSSTVAVYGEPEKIPTSESNPCRPTSLYGRTKRMIEEILADYGQVYGLKYVSGKGDWAANQMGCRKEMAGGPGGAGGGQREGGRGFWLGTPLPEYRRDSGNSLGMGLASSRRVGGEGQHP